MCYTGLCGYETREGTCNIVPDDCPCNTNDKRELSTEDIKELKKVLLPMSSCKNCLFSNVCEILVDGYNKDICQMLEG